jgi:hypothetical protein
VIEVYDEVEDVWAFCRHLPHDNFASTPCWSCKIVRIELLTQLESIEIRLYNKLVGIAPAGWWCLNKLEVGYVCQGRIERFEEKVEAVTSRLQR